MSIYSLTKKFIISIMVLCLSISFFLVNVKAEQSPTYINLYKNTCYVFTYPNNRTINVKFDYDVRYTNYYLVNSTDYSVGFRIWAPYPNQFRMSLYTDNTCSTIDTSWVTNGYVSSSGFGNAGGYYIGSSARSTTLSYSNFGLPLQEVTSDSPTVLIKLLNGSTAVGGEYNPEPEITYGNLVNLGLGTQYLTNREFAMNENIDTIHWNNSYDSLGNDIKDFSVRIRAVQTEYVSGTVGELASLNWQDVRVKDKTYNLGTFSASTGKASFTWGQVVGGLNIASYLKTQINDNSQYSTQGWFYEVQLFGDGYEGDWQKVYTMSSSPPANQNTFTKQDTFNQGIVTSINSVVSKNQTTNNNIYNYENTYNNIIINNNNSDYQDNVDGKPWYAWLLEAITNLFGKLLDLIGGAFSDLISGLVDLIKTLGVDVIGFFTNIFNNLQDLLSNLDFDNNLDLNPDISDNLELLDIPKTLLQGFFDAGLGYMILIPLVLGIIFKVF